jgi:hypothetical protein
MTPSSHHVSRTDFMWILQHIFFIVYNMCRTHMENAKSPSSDPCARREYIKLQLSIQFLFVIKPTGCTKFTNIFCHETLNVSDMSSVHHQGFIHCTLSNGISYTCVPSWSYSKAVYKSVWHTPLLSVQWIISWWWTDELSETCRVSWQNKFVKLVHLVGFITKKFVTMYGHMNVKKIVFT